MRRIGGVKTAEKRRMDELRVEVGLEESSIKKLMRCRLKWAIYFERMGDGKLAKRLDAQKEEGKGGEEDQECDGRTVLREIWKEWEENGDQQRKIEGVGDC